MAAQGPVRFQFASLGLEATLRDMLARALEYWRGERRRLDEGLDDRENHIASRETSVERTLQQQFGDGTWEVGVDIEPGRYRIEPDSGCYWARLRDRGAGVDSVIQNANPRGQQEIVDIAGSDGYF